jgi:hypothetical protein
VAQSQRESTRSVSDLRNIVDRLDVLLGTSGEEPDATNGMDDRAGLESMLSDLTDRLASLEGEVDELRTLVNHLMTIATWQAKVTATLVGEEADDEFAPDDVDDEAAHRDDDPPYQSQPYEQAKYGAASAASSPEQHTRLRAESAPAPSEPPSSEPPPPQRRAAPSLDDDIDGILGPEPDAPREDPPSPDFGI